MSMWNYLIMWSKFFIYESALPIHLKCGSIHKGHVSFCWSPEARANPNLDGKFFMGILS